jgi:HEAT repeat protein
MTSTNESLQYQSEPVSAWLALLDDPEEERRSQAAQKLLEVSAAIAEVLPALSGVLRNAAPPVRARAATVLGDLGTKMLATLPSVRSALRSIILTDSDEDVRTSALQALALLGPDSQGNVGSLMTALKDSLPEVRLSAAHALGEHGSKARDAVPALTTALLHDTSSRVRLEAAVAIWRIDRRSVRVLPMLIQALEDRDEVRRWIAADCLGDMGAEAREAIPALQQLLRTPFRSRLIRMSIALALQRIDPDAVPEEVT